MGFKEILKMLRSEKNISQAKLAKSLNLERYIVSNWEQGRTEPNIDDLIRLSDFFSISVDELIGKESDYNSLIKHETTLPEKKKAPIAERTQLSEIQENFISEFKEFFSEKTFWKYAQLYQAMDRDTRIFALGYLCSYLKNVGMNVDAFLK